MIRVPMDLSWGKTFRKKVKLTFVELAGRQYRHEEIEVTPEDTSFSLKNKIEERIRREGSQHLYKVILRGQRDPQFLPDCSLYRSAAGFLRSRTGLCRPFRWKS